MNNRGNRRPKSGPVPGQNRSTYVQRRELASIERKQILLFCLLALLLHLPMLELLNFSIRFQPEPVKDSRVEFTEVMLVAPADADRMREDQQKRKILEEKQREQEKERERDKGQVVELGRVVEQRPPDKDTRFLAEVDSRVERETRKSGEKGSAPAAVVPPPPAPVPAHEQAEAMVAPETEERAQVQEQAPPPADNTAVPHPSLEISPPSMVRFNHGLLPREDILKLDSINLDPLATLQMPEKHVPKTAPSYSNLLPGKEAPHPTAMRPSPNHMETSGGTSDYLADVEEGDATMLNARQFTYWSFFQRIKDNVRAQWKPMLEYRRRDPTGQVHGGKDRVTVLKVMLKDDGTLMDAFVITESGLDFLDREALKAFEKAQPFPNPPDGLKDENGVVTFQFGFYLEINNKPAIRMFRLGG